MKLYTQRINDFSGGMNDGATSAAAFAKNQVERMVNVRPDFDGSAAVRGGTRKLSAASPVIAGEPLPTAQIIPFLLANGSRQLLLVGQPDVYVSYDDGATWVAIDAGPFDSGQFYDYATFQFGGLPHLFLVNGDFRLFWDGSDLLNWTACPVGAKYVAVNDGRVWVAGHAGNRILGSKTADPFDFNLASDALDIAIGDANPLRGLHESQAKLLCFKDDSVAYVDGYGSSDIYVASGSQGASGSVGCVNFRTIQPAGDQGLCWLSRRGIEFFDGDRIRSIGQGARRFLDDTKGMHAAPQTHASYFPARDEYMLLGGDPGFEEAAMGVGVNLTTGAAHLVRFGSTESGTLISAATATELGAVGLHTSGGDGTFGIFPVRLETGTSDLALPSTLGGVPIEAQMRGPAWDFGTPAPKRARLMRTTAGGAGVLETAVIRDGTGGTDYTHVLLDTVPETVLDRVAEQGGNLAAYVAMIGGQRVTAMEISAEVLGGIR